MLFGFPKGFQPPGEPCAVLGPPHWQDTEGPLSTVPWGFLGLFLYHIYYRQAVVNIRVFRQLLYIVHMALQVSLHHTSKLRTKRKTELGYVGNWGFGVSYHPLPSLQLLQQSLLTSITFLPVFKPRWKVCTKDLAAPQGVNCSSKHFRRHRSAEVWVTAGIGSVI